MSKKLSVLLEEIKYFRNNASIQKSKYVCLKLNRTDNFIMLLALRGSTRAKKSSETKKENRFKHLW